MKMEDFKRAVEIKHRLDAIVDDLLRLDVLRNREALFKITGWHTDDFKTDIPISCSKLIFQIIEKSLEDERIALQKEFDNLGKGRR